jgi:hypothetical protein
MMDAIITLSLQGERLNINSNSNQKRIAFGYNRNPVNRIELHPGQAAAVQLIYKSYAEGQSITAIAEMLKSAGIPSPQNKPSWGKQTIANILSNPHYHGDNDYPRIIETELFDTVQMLKGKRAPVSKI